MKSSITSEWAEAFFRKAPQFYGDHNFPVEARRAMSIRLTKADIRKLPKEIREHINKVLATKKAAAPSPVNPFGHIQSGVRPDIGPMRFRSKMEANYARYLNFLKARKVITDWKYESKTFWFEGIRRGTVSYLPDFEVFYPDMRGSSSSRTEFHEVKGRMDSKSATKLKRMKKYHPDVKVIMIDVPSYKKIVSECAGAIHGWEK